MKITVGLIASAITVGLLFAVRVFAFDPLQYGPAYPTYIDHKCGSVIVAQYAQVGDVYAFRFSTVCAGAGRGAKSTVYLTCWSFTSQDGYTIDASEELLAAQWKIGGTVVACPAL